MACPMCSLFLLLAHPLFKLKPLPSISVSPFDYPPSTAANHCINCYRPCVDCYGPRLANTLPINAPCYQPLPNRKVIPISAGFLCHKFSPLLSIFHLLFRHSPRDLLSNTSPLVISPCTTLRDTLAQTNLASTADQQIKPQDDWLLKAHMG